MAITPLRMIGSAATIWIAVACPGVPATARQDVAPPSDLQSEAVASPSPVDPGAEPQPVRSASVALTFDDLPFVHATAHDAAEARRSSDTIRRALRRHSAPATGFVNEVKVRALGEPGVAILRSWNSGSLQLGNHGYAHADSNNLTLDQIAAEVDVGETTIARLAKGAGRTIRYFRFPHNHVGNTEERRIAIEQLLTARGYVQAASTIDTSDYVFDQAHRRATSAHDRAMRKRIEAAYLDYTRTQLGYYASLNRTVLGYEPPEIMLLHLNGLNAAVIEPLLRIFEQSGYRFVTLDQAQSDPAYRRPPAYATKYGPMWGYRWARERGVKVDGRQEKDPPEWLTTYADGK